MDEMEKALREELEKHLDTLRRNLEVVPMDVLKTKYKKPYQELKESICKAATAYTRHVSLGGIRIKQKYGDEATSYANEAVKDSQCLKRISEAAFDRQDMNEIAALAKQLREEILQVLHVFYLQHMCIYVSKECMSDHHLVPEVYNDATAQVWRNGEWQTMTIDNESITRIDGNSKGTTVRINGLIDYFDCSENDLKSLDVSHNAILATLDCYWTGITALDLSKNTALGKLNCSYNSIGTLDLSNNKALFSLSCYNCELGSLDLSNNTELEEAVVKNNELTSLTVSSNTKLLLLDVQNNEQLKSIDASMLTDLEELQCSYTGLTTLDVTYNTKLVKLICSNNKLTTLDLSKNTLLERLFCDGNQLTSLDLSNNTKLNYLECSGNGMSACALNDLYYNLPKCSTTPTNVNMFIAGINNPNEAEGSETSMATKKGWKVSVDGDGSGCNEAYITIEPTENGTLELRNSDNEIVNSGSKVIKNTTVTVKGNPDEGFYLKNVWVNGVSVTNGEFVVKMASVVTAAFDEGSSITEIENSGMKIWSTPGIIRVNAENAHVQVYSTSGALVWEGNIYQEKTIDATRGIYIVKVRNAQSTQSKKIVVE